MNIPQVKITDVCDIIAGQAPHSKTYNENGKGTLFVRAGDYGNLYPSSKTYTTQPIAVGKEGDVFLCVVGATSGKVNLGINASITRSIFALRPNERILQKYLYYYLKSEYEILNYMKSGSAQGIINKKTLDHVFIPLPTINQQKEVVKILDLSFKLKDERDQANQMPKKILQGFFIQMFGDPLTNPKKWATRKLEDVCRRIVGGGTPSKSIAEYYVGTIPWVTPKDMKRPYINDSIDHINEKAIKESSTKLIPENSLLMVIRSGILKKKLPVAINLRPVAINQDMKAFMFLDNIVNPNFMLHLLENSQRSILKKVRVVTADNLEFNDLKRMEIIVPPIELQNAFSKLVESIEKLRQKQLESSNLIENLFKALTDKAFNGELINQSS